MNKQLQFLKKLIVLCSISLLLCLPSIKGQSLNPGELAVIGWNALTNEVNAVDLWGGANQLDNVQYTGSTTASDRDTWLERITEISNWTGTDDPDEDLENPITSAPDPVVNIIPPCVAPPLLTTQSTLTLA